MERVIYMQNKKQRFMTFHDNEIIFHSRIEINNIIVLTFWGLRNSRYGQSYKGGLYFNEVLISGIKGLLEDVRE